MVLGFKTMWKKKHGQSYYKNALEKSTSCANFFGVFSESGETQEGAFGDLSPNKPKPSCESLM